MYCTIKIKCRFEQRLYVYFTFYVLDECIIRSTCRLWKKTLQKKIKPCIPLTCRDCGEIRPILLASARCRTGSRLSFSHLSFRWRQVKDLSMIIFCLMFLTYHFCNISIISLYIIFGHARSVQAQWGMRLSIVCAQNRNLNACKTSFLWYWYIMFILIRKGQGRQVQFSLYRYDCVAF